MYYQECILILIFFSLFSKKTSSFRLYSDTLTEDCPVQIMVDEQVDGDDDCIDEIDDTIEPIE